jgi:lipopolysaccharide/colanic/teichoic acid biosynthesis glycosyltransferase
MNAQAAMSREPVVTLSTVEPFQLTALSTNLRCIQIDSLLNDARYLSKFISAVNNRLPMGGLYLGRIETSEYRKARLLGTNPGLLRHLRYTADYFLHRVLPKLPYIKRAYFSITRGRARVISKGEILGRLVASGFDIISYSEDEGILAFTARKARLPLAGAAASYGPLLKMKRVGQGGEKIDVYKFRTMHPFAEHLQSYIVAQNELHSSGKINNDFRVMTAGRFLRKYWLDELPMIINWVKRDLKLVGVRPLSEHYFSLYPQDLATMRIRSKPGLIPPFYADLPKNFDEILESERRYLERYQRAPIRTDLRYLARAVRNIVLRGARSS